MLKWIANPLYDNQVVAEYEIKTTNSRALLARLMLFNLAGSLLFSTMYWFFDPYSDVYLYLFAAGVVYFIGYVLTPFVSVTLNVYCFLLTFTVIQNLVNFFVVPLETMNYLFILTAPSGLLLFTDVVSKWQRFAIAIFVLVMVLLLFIVGNDSPMITLSTEHNRIVSIAVVLVFFISSIATYDLYVQKMKVLQQRLVDLANKDELTGLFNRRALFYFGNEVLAHVSSERKKSAAMMIDIDYFKKINDVYGHAVGDKVIRGVSQYLRSLEIPGIVCGRYGGEEFAVFVPDISLAEVSEHAEHIRRAIEQLSFSLEDSSTSNANLPESGDDEQKLAAALSRIKITVSIGIAVQESRLETLDTLFDKADKGLYHAKNSGRNRVEMFSFKW
jgi:diguanylate cyclase (GGDEF)-like protein